MKGNKILALIWVLIAALLCYIFVTKMVNRNYSWNWNIFNRGSSVVMGNSELTDSYSYSAGSINEIDVDVSSMGVRFEKASGSNIEVEVYGAEDNEVSVSTVGGALKISSVKKNVVVFIGVVNRVIVVKVPASNRIATLDIASSSGSVKCSDLDLGKVDVRVMSGSVKFENVNVASSIDVDSKSGSIKLEQVEASEIDLHSASGSVNVSGAFDRFEVKSSSGSVHMDLDKMFTKDSEVNSSSGSIHINVPNNADFDVDYKLSSGSYHNSLTGSDGKRGNERVGSGGPKLRVTAASGSVHID